MKNESCPSFSALYRTSRISADVRVEGRPSSGNAAGARSTVSGRLRPMIAVGALFAIAVYASTAAAECSPKARALGKCPPPAHSTVLKSKSYAHGAGVVPQPAASTDHRALPKTRDRLKSGPPVGPGPAEHTGRNEGMRALNTQPIPPGRTHRAPPRVEPGAPGGH